MGRASQDNGMRDARCEMRDVGCEMWDARITDTDHDHQQEKAPNRTFPFDQIDNLLMMFTFLPYGSDNYFSSDKKAGGMDRAGGCANGGFPRAVHSFASGTGAIRRS